MKLIFYKTASDLSAFATFSWRIEKNPVYFTTLGNIVFHKTAKFRKGFTFNKYQAHDGIARVWLRSCTAWKVSKYRVISGPYFPVFELSTENLRIQSEYRKIRTRNNSVFGYFSRSDGVMIHLNVERTSHLLCCI